jgi:hypothetical protein
VPGAIPRRAATALVALMLTFAPALALGGPATGSAAPDRLGPACFGAAARDAARPCANPALRFHVTPSPAEAELEPGSPCALVATTGDPHRICEFAWPKRSARRTVALLGDSHAPAWRGAVAGLALSRRWRGLTVRRSSCPFSTTPHVTDQAGGAACFAWVRAATMFFVHHPQISTVFVVQSSAYRFLPGPDGDVHAAAVGGYREALDALPLTVRHVVVVRDNPLARDDTLGCVAAAVAQGQRADLRCAIPRELALLPDPAAEAATQLRTGRGRVIDLSSVFCDSARCFPVIGGALVYRDKSHLTQTFAASLAPLLRRAYDALGLPAEG